MHFFFLHHHFQTKALCLKISQKSLNFIILLLIQLLSKIQVLQENSETFLAMFKHCATATDHNFSRARSDCEIYTQHSMATLLCL